MADFFLQRFYLFQLMTQENKHDPLIGDTVRDGRKISFAIYGTCKNVKIFHFL